MKNPHKHSLNHQDQKPLPVHSPQTGPKATPLFEQQSPSYRSKSIHQKVSQLNDNLILSSIKQHDYRKAISLLHQLETYIHKKNQSSNQTSCTNKLLFYHELSVCYYNHAVVYQKVSNDEETAKYFEKALKNLEHMQGYITSREQGVSYSIEVAKIQIQYCSILSQTGKHSQAITYAEKALLKLIESFRILEAICFQFVMQTRLPETTSSSRDINFKKFVVLEAQKMLKQLSNLPEPHQLPTQFRKKYDRLMQKTFFWKDNSQNNQKQLRKQLQTERKQVNSDRNILGVQKNSFLSQNLTLEALTNLEVKSINYSFNKDPFFVLSTPKLTEMAFYVAMVYFMLATEIRFSQVDLNVQKLKIDEKYKKLSRDERMIKCKMIHMKAIEIAGKFLPENNQFFTHILNRFNKNYKCVMEEIHEESKEHSIKELSSQNESQNLIAKNILPEQQYAIQNTIKNGNHHYLGFSFKPNSQHSLRDSQSPSLAQFKKLKKNKIFQSPRGQQPNKIPNLKPKISSNKQKEKLYNFHKHQRSISQQQTHKRSISLNKRDRCRSSTKIMSSYNGQTEKRQRTKTVMLSVKKSDQRLLRKKSNQEEVFARVNFTNLQNMINNHLKNHQLMITKQKSREKLKLKGFISPPSKGKLSTIKTKLKTQENNDYGKMAVRPEKKFKFHLKLLQN